MEVIYLDVYLNSSTDKRIVVYRIKILSSKFLGRYVLEFRIL